MFSNKLKCPALALAVTAGLLTVAGPASAARVNDLKVMPPNDATSSSMWAWHEAARAGIYEGTEAKGVMTWNPGEGSDVVAGPTGLKFDSNEWAEDLGFTAPPEMDANANAFMPEVLAGINYEPDFFW